VEQLRLRLQGPLAERFQVRLHRETKTLPVYYLIVAKHGPKLQPAEKAPEFKDDAERRAAMQKLALNNLNAMQQPREFWSFRWFCLASATMGKFAERLSSDRPYGRGSDQSGRGLRFLAEMVTGGGQADGGCAVGTVDLRGRRNSWG